MAADLGPKKLALRASVFRRKSIVKRVRNMRMLEKQDSEKVAIQPILKNRLEKCSEARKRRELKSAK